MVQLALQGMGPATVALPLGARGPRPVIVGVHGHSVRPEHACKSWQRASGGRAFVLCPHGLPADAGPDQVVTLGTAQYTLREIDAGMEQLRRRYAGYVAEGPLVYAGYSLGARNGVSIVAENAGRFPLVALGEGGYDELDDRTIERWSKVGVQKLLLVCSSKACELTFGRVLTRCEKSGLACRLVPSGENPHLFAGKVVEATHDAWPWLVEGDRRFTAPP